MRGRELATWGIMPLSPLPFLAILVLGCSSTSATGPSTFTDTAPGIDVPVTGPSFAAVTRNKAPWSAERRSLYQIPGYTSFAFGRDIPGTPYREQIAFIVKGELTVGTYRRSFRIRFSEDLPALLR